MKNRIYKLLTVLVVLVAFSACTVEDYTGHSNATVVSVTATSTFDMASDQTEPLYADQVYFVEFTLSAPQIVDVSFNIVQTDGTLDGDDYEISNHGNVYIVAGDTTGSAMITIFADGTGEDPESATLKVVGTGNASVSNGDFSFTVTEPSTCNWVLDMEDSYGDGWNGAKITFDVDNGSAVLDYTLDGGSSGQHIIPVPDGYDLVVSYSSGAWDGEVYYALTAPDGTVYTDWYYPSVGVLFDGVNDCN